MEDGIRIFKVIALLLQYPSSDLIEALPELEEVIDRCPQSEAWLECGSFISYLQAAPLHDLQIEYTAQFDFDPNTCLNLTFHECGDTRERGLALVRFKEIYRSAGYEPSTSELPDYLPMLLEFLAVCPRRVRAELLSRYGTHISTVAARLKERDSPYVRPFEALSMIIPEFTGRGE